MVNLMKYIFVWNSNLLMDMIGFLMADSLSWVREVVCTGRLHYDNGKMDSTGTISNL